MKRNSILALCTLLVLAGACSGLGLPAQGPTQVPVPSATPLPAAEVLFRVLPPDGTPPDADLALAVLDTVTGAAYNAQEFPMSRLEDGRWQVRLRQAAGSVLHYRYVRRAPQQAVEISALGAPVRTRLALLPGPLEVDDIVAAWADVPYQGPVGRVTGHVRDRTTGAPLEGLVVNAAGVEAFTDGEGGFRLEGLPPGLHQINVLAPDSAYEPVEQGAVVAAGSATPAELTLQPAPSVQVTFELTVPSDTVPGTPIRMVGNVLALGDVFAELPGGVGIAAGRAPALTRVDETHYILILGLHAGTDLRYKYTLGDGLWNAERGSGGGFVTRELIVPSQDTIVADQVHSWRGDDRGSITFHATVPDGTSPEDVIAIQFDPFTWFEPLPMWRLGENEWFFVLQGPLNISGALGYRYCRNLECGGADDVDTQGPDPVGRLATVTLVSQDLRDAVQHWQWEQGEGEGAATPVVAPDIQPQPGFETGIELAPGFKPGRLDFYRQGMADIAGLGANTVTLTPTWVLDQRGGLPFLSFDPRTAPFRQDLKKLVDMAHDAGLRVALRPTLEPAGGARDDWWAGALRDPGWWGTWFEGYRSFILTYARAASDLGVDRLIVSADEVAPALPGGVLRDGSPSGVPGDAEARWTALIDEIEGLYPGTLALELEVGADGLQPPPSFTDRFDAVHLYWHVPLAEPGAGASVAEMQAAAAQALDDAAFNNPNLEGLPIVLDVEYLSVQGGAAACPPQPDGSCRRAGEFDFGASVDPDLAVDLAAQASAINAMLLEAYERDAIHGVYVRRFNPIVSLQDKSGSVRGKPARDVLWYWYPRLTGTTAP